MTPTQFSFGHYRKTVVATDLDRVAIFHITIGATLYECFKEIERGRAGTFP